MIEEWLDQREDFVAACADVITVHGGITRANIDSVAALRPDIIVTGSAIFEGQSPRENREYIGPREAPLLVNGTDMRTDPDVRARYRSVIGRRQDHLITPALVLDLDATQRNIRSMADRLRPLPAKLRPHIKVHKSPEVARMQIEAGAIGVATATVTGSCSLPRHRPQHRFHGRGAAISPSQAQAAHQSTSRLWIGWRVPSTARSSTVNRPMKTLGS
jgi:hypothetical protein